MRDVEKRLAELARGLRSDSDEHADVAAALAAIREPLHPSRRGKLARVPSTWPVLVSAAACTVALAVGAGWLLARNGPTRLHATAETPPGSIEVHEPADPAPPTSGGAAAPGSTSSATTEVTADPDLQAPAAGREITFEGIGEVQLGDVLDPTVVTSHEGGSCGYWGPTEPSHNGDEPLRGIAADAGTVSPTVATIRVWRNPTFRTASGVGVGTTLGTLERLYGDRLVVDVNDGWEHPTAGLLGLYQDVAAVRHGGNALTFLLRDGRVEEVKLSDAAFWGDDEGCV